LHPSNKDWLEDLKKFVEVYFAHESRESIKLRLLDILRTVLWDYAIVEQDDALETILPFFQTLHSLPLSPIIIHTISLMVAAAREIKLSEKRFDGIIQNLNKIVQYSQQQEIRIMAVSGMIELFKVKFRTLPCTEASIVYNCLIKLVDSDDAQVREKVLLCLMTLRANKFYQLSVSCSCSCFAHTITNTNNQHSLTFYYIIVGWRLECLSTLSFTKCH